MLHQALRRDAAEKAFTRMALDRCREQGHVPPGVAISEMTSDSDLARLGRKSSNSQDSISSDGASLEIGGDTKRTGFDVAGGIPNVPRPPWQKVCVLFTDLRIHPHISLAFAESPRRCISACRGLDSSGVDPVCRLHPPRKDSVRFDVPAARRRPVDDAREGLVPFGRTLVDACLAQRANESFQGPGCEGADCERHCWYELTTCSSSSSLTGRRVTRVSTFAGTVAPELWDAHFANEEMLRYEAPLVKESFESFWDKVRGLTPNHLTTFLKRFDTYVNIYDALRDLHGYK